MTPQEQIAALMAGVDEQPPEAVTPCKAKPTHKLLLRLRWEDDLSPVPSAKFDIYKGAALFASDMVAKGVFTQKKVHAGSYRVFFPEIDESEIAEE
ncbi:hypothetical protein IP87_12715 [beta proteobacterium AAP121]|nr:hypothetical protein IP80_15240 [beta proteobacterium AAP65]KPF97079.1 hypothetical protein IP87_12715 [beta proteobacterium AAP121]